MILEACRCNWGIEGVAELPAHHHPWSPLDRCHPELRVVDGRTTVVLVTDRDPEREPAIWVDWKEVARCLA